MTHRIQDQVFLILFSDHFFKFPLMRLRLWVYKGVRAFGDGYCVVPEIDMQTCSAS